MDITQTWLTGEHVHLEPLRFNHARELFAAVDDPRMFEYLAPNAMDDEVAFKKWIDRRIRERETGRALPFVQRDRATGRAYGCTGMFNMNRRHRRVEIGHTWVARSHRRTPCNTEAKLLMLRHAFEDLGAVRVQFTVDNRNTVAQQALEKMGAVKEGIMRNQRILTDGFCRHAAVYSVIREEWGTVETTLQTLVHHRIIQASMRA